MAGAMGLPLIFLQAGRQHDEGGSTIRDILIVGDGSLELRSELDQ
jgi:hypothetical protein